MTKILETVNAFVWGIPALSLILGIGLWMTLRTGFVQLRMLPKSLRSFFSRLAVDSGAGAGTTSFRALCTALAATVGTGNLAGVAGAIAIGGPGSIFWMWICGILGMGLKFAEATLAVRFRHKNPDGCHTGGAMYMIEKGMGKKFSFLATWYCFFGVVASFGVGNGTQMNAVLTGIRGIVDTFHLPVCPGIDLMLGSLLSVLVISLLLGGAKRIGSVVEMLVPFAATLYILLAVGAMICRADRLPGAVEAIFTGAFSPKAVTGGVVGSALLTLRIGVSRGVFTNEAGMGTAAIAHGAADVAHPVQQGLMGIVEVFLDTMVICTMTALVILSSGAEIHYGLDEGLGLTIRAFSAVYGSWVGVLITLETCCFAFATVLGWSLYGGRCAQYLLGDSAWNTYVWLQGAFVILSSVLNTGTVWLIAEIVNGLMSIPNMIVLAYLMPELITLLKSYPDGMSVKGGTYEYFHQCKPLRTLSYEKVSPLCGEGTATGKSHLSPEYRSAGSCHTTGIL